MVTDSVFPSVAVHELDTVKKWKQRCDKVVKAYVLQVNLVA